MSRKMPAGYVPHDAEAEAALCGAVLIDAGVLDLVQLEPGQFYAPQHQTVWAAAKRLHARQVAIDEVTLGAELEADGKLDAVGGLSFLADLALRTPTASNAEYYAAIVRERHVRRQLMLEAAELLEAARRGDRDAGELQGDAIERLRKIAVAGDRRLQTMGDLMIRRYDEVVKLSMRRAAGDVAAAGLPTGIPQLDDLLSGLQRGIPTVLTGRPSMGKSALAQTMVVANVEAGVGVLEYRIEDTDEASADRMLSRISNVPAEDLRAGKITGVDTASLNRGIEQWHRQCRRYWHLDGRGDVSAEDIVRDTRRRRGQIENLQLVVVDLLNELRWPRGAKDMQDAMSRSLRTLGTLAREDNLAVLILCQLNRKLEERADKRPRLSDLKETGALEERGKCVLSVYRGVFYGEPTEGVDYPRGSSPPHEDEWRERVEIGVLKNSNGRNNVVVRAKWHGPTVRIYQEATHGA